MTTRYDAIIIGTGRAGPPLAVRLAGARMKVAIINNSTMMEVDFLPEHLIVIGGSYVGLEFAVLRLSAPFDSLLLNQIAGDGVGNQSLHC